MATNILRNTMIAKAVSDSVQRVEMNYIECLIRKSEIESMYTLNHAIQRDKAERKAYFDAITLKPKYIRFIQEKEGTHGSALMWSKEFIDKLDNEFIQKYM